MHWYEPFNDSKTWETHENNYNNEARLNRIRKYFIGQDKRKHVIGHDMQKRDGME